MRLFLASGFSAPVIERVKEIQAYAAPRLGKAVKWVEPENIHLTYIFLGETPEALAPAVIRGAERCAGLFKRLEVSLAGLGAFPCLESPRVLWLGLKEDRPGTLKELALRLSEALAAQGLKFETRFEPHITIGRLKARPDPAVIAELRGRAAALEGRSVIGSVEVMESRLTAAGPAYAALSSARLL
ncbi:MAG TPA: RNA 2',3'-cyclic phosphodiesterase [Elusimicrobiales bacterium]|nr:RNA 2',3'-cyclic phosphodiesterase [Elusimicrobiales bacterium]